MYILSKETMYKCDNYTINTFGLPGRLLMENAGKGSYEFIHDKILHKEKSNIIVFCGHGNNGGDGFVIARYLKNNKHKVRIVLTGNPDKMSEETEANYKLCQTLGIPINIVTSFADYSDLNIKPEQFDLTIDAIFGVGFKGTARGMYKELILEINRNSHLIIAVDIASGVEADTGKAEIAIKADYTLTMAAFKYGHFLEKGREMSGETIVIDIGMPALVYKKFSPTARLVTAENLELPLRNPYSHKGDYGKIGIIAGSPGFTGAGIMATTAAVRSGSGLVTLFHPDDENLKIIFESQLTEVMTAIIPQNIANDENWEAFKQNIADKDALLIGPGLGKSAEKANLLKKILTFWNKPMVIDADAVNILSQHREYLQYLKDKPFMLTPHIGEFARLHDKSIAETLSDPLQYLNNFAKEHGTNVLLKSATTIFSDGEYNLFDISGNDALSTGGSGDVLAGIIVSFLGQGLALSSAAISASCLMGKTAEKLSEQFGTASVIPTDIIKNLRL